MKSFPYFWKKAQASSMIDIYIYKKFPLGDDNLICTGPTDPNFQQMEKIKILILNQHVKKLFCCFHNYVKFWEFPSFETLFNLKK